MNQSGCCWPATPPVSQGLKVEFTARNHGVMLSYGGMLRGRLALMSPFSNLTLMLVWKDGSLKSCGSKRMVPKKRLSSWKAGFCSNFWLFHRPSRRIASTSLIRTWLMSRELRVLPYEPVRNCTSPLLRNSALWVEAFTMPAGLPNPKRIEFGPRWMSTRSTMYESHGMSVTKKSRVLSAEARPRTRWAPAGARRLPVSSTLVPLPRPA